MLKTKYYQEICHIEECWADQKGLSFHMVDFSWILRVGNSMGRAIQHRNPFTSDSFSCGFQPEDGQSSDGTAMRVLQWGRTKCLTWPHWTLWWLYRLSNCETNPLGKSRGWRSYSRWNLLPPTRLVLETQSPVRKWRETRGMWNEVPGSERRSCRDFLLPSSFSSHPIQLGHGVSTTIFY